jgi:GT2 family glycosyltransferase
MNLGWEARDPDSKYVAFLNNDLIVNSNSLREIVERMEAEPDVGAASGLIYFGDGRTVYSAGGAVTELWNVRGVCYGVSESECRGRERAHYVTYADGAYMVVRVGAVKDTPLGRPFLDEAFLFFDDYLLGLVLWNRGWKVRYYPVSAGLHFAHRTVKPVLNYYCVRAHVALMSVVRTRFEGVRPLYLLRRLAARGALCAKGSRASCGIVRAIYDGLRLGSLALRKIGRLTLYRAPHVRSTIGELRCFTLGICRELRVLHGDLIWRA